MAMDLTIQVERFLKCSKVVKTFGYIPVISETQKNELIRLFAVYSLSTMDHNDRNRVANFLFWNLDGYLERFQQAKVLTRGSKESFICLYGEKEGIRRFNELAKTRSINNKSKNTPMEDFINRNKLSSLTEKQKLELSRVFELDIRIYDWNETICRFITNDLDDYVGRIKKIQTMYGKNGTLEYHQLLYGDVEGLRIYNDVNTRKKKGQPFQLEYWLARGYSLSEAKELVIVHQKKAGKLRAKLTPEEHKKRSVRCVQYWIERGFTVDEASAKVKNIQSIGSLENFIKRYGEVEGKNRWIARQEKWLSSMNNKSTEEKTKILRKKSVKIGQASKQSLSLFNPIIDYCQKINVKYYVGTSGNIEYFINDIKNTGRFYSYDFTIPALKLIIEFNGETWHPNKEKLSEDEFNKWRNPISGKTAEEQYHYDILKKQVATARGFKVITIWSSDNIQQKIDEIITLINRLIG